MTILTHTLGFPRVGLRRELKKAQESYWAGTQRVKRYWRWARTARASLGAAETSGY
ncbi:5-methyltetrahydropteroyltriglutamate--homocysteine S-methyltransferase [Salmonella enterica subsp. enterica]|uniref:5-methyltetrahydropteroyltriglutamate--homocysteine S-methyltransferase n=1 Tax=Salmonella enterica I TaxID=59201 RepID=A0A379WJU6_SALET|nr:5-methyltetrahydropteroyltriglutamate--homocysteine S-methyltransferase [Salmonella enterica subsp. enterica]